MKLGILAGQARREGKIERLETIIEVLRMIAEKKK